VEREILGLLLFRIGSRKPAGQPATKVRTPILTAACISPMASADQCHSNQRNVQPQGPSGCHFAAAAPARQPQCSGFTWLYQQP
jgi:hypothetical protein